jgi:hypothetical protein
MQSKPHTRKLPDQHAAINQELDRTDFGWMLPPRRPSRAERCLRLCTSGFALIAHTGAQDEERPLRAVFLVPTVCQESSSSLV